MTMNAIAREQQEELKIRIEPLRQRVELWRQNKATNEKMPELLWEEATALAKVYGVSPVQGLLRIDYRGLERRALGISKPAVKARPGEVGRPKFVELPAVAVRRPEHLGPGQTVERSVFRGQGQTFVRVIFDGSHGSPHTRTPDPGLLNVQTGRLDPSCGRLAGRVKTQAQPISMRLGTGGTAPPPLGPLLACSYPQSKECQPGTLSIPERGLGGGLGLVPSHEIPLCLGASVVKTQK
jgi:hypothetical protein